MKRSICKVVCTFFLILSVVGNGVLIPNQAFADEAETALTIGETKQATSITKDGITFYFSESRTIGKFANGDFWVLAPVMITKITPDFDGYNNGWEVNPVVDGSHGFQDGGQGGGFDASLVPDLPYTADKTLSIVKTTPTGEARPCIKNAVVLTVVDAIPPDNGRAVFRPPYVGTEKPFYKVEDLRTDLLPSYEPVANMPTLESIANRFSSLQLDHKTGVIGRSLRPQDNMMDYQPKNTPAQNNAVLRFMIKGPIEEKMPALINFVQFGIDKVHTVYLGQKWPAGGGHQPGHRIVLAFTAVMLDLDEAKEMLRNADFFHANYFFYKGETGLTIWGENSTEKGYWSYISNERGSRSQKDPYGLIDGGVAGAAYQYITAQSHKGEILATHLMPVLKEAWNMDEWELARDYTDRWVLHGTWASPDPYAPYDKNNSNYGITYGPDKDTGIPIAGSGRYSLTDGASRDSGQYRSSFVAAMWDAYRNTAEGTETTPPFAAVCYPFDGSISSKNISNTVELKAKAFGVHGIESVQFLVNGKNLGAPVTMVTDVYTNMYRYFWDISDVQAGTYSISAIATDKKANTYTAMAQELEILEMAEADMLKLIPEQAPVGSIANGTAKTAEALMLPQQITIVTYDGVKKANVTWDVNSCSYAPSNTKEQTFTVTGDVSLPPAVLSNPDIPLKSNITVTVNAATGSDKVLQSISAPARITGIANGTAKTAETLGLPKKVIITTDGGKMATDVSWDVEKCSYDPASLNSQNFTVNGTIALPTGVVNSKKVKLTTSVNVTVYAADPTDRELTGITPPTPVKNVPNGAAKTATALRLPTTVTMVTDKGSLQASVNWDVDSCTYDPKVKESQTLTVEGTVVLPSGVVNSNNIPLTVSVQVTVEKAASKPTPTPTLAPSPTPTKKPSPTPTKKPNQSESGSGGGSTSEPIKKLTPTPKPTSVPSPTPKPQDGNTDIPTAEELITADYPEMVKLLEMLYESANIRDNTMNPTYGIMMRREPVVTLTAGYQSKLRELAMLTFSDIRGDEWYASHIPLAVYRKFVKGFPRGTFSGGNLVTRAEVLTMLARFNSSEGMIKQKAVQDTESFIRIAEQIGNDWYTHYVVAAKEGLVYPDLYTRQTILQPMTRGEVFFALANFLWSEDIREGGKYYTLAESNETPAFNDTVKTIYMSNPDAGVEGPKCYCWYNQLMNAA
ncbi:MAG: hypothetical protein GX144_06725, partial [Clostridiaceae bacterium]|nr:hypothetical protein [Clostridiaceae bacterium]